VRCPLLGKIISALKVTIADLGGEYQLTAHSNHNNPAALTVSGLSYYLP